MFVVLVPGHRSLGRENTRVCLHQEVVPYHHVPVHPGLVELSLEADFLTEVQVAQFTMVHNLQRDLGFICTSHHVLIIGYLQSDGCPTCGKTLWRKYSSLDKTDVGACVKQHIQDTFDFPSQGPDLDVKLPLAANLTHSVHAENFQPFQKLNQRLLQVVDN